MLVLLTAIPNATACEWESNRPHPIEITAREVSVGPYTSRIVGPKHRARFVQTLDECNAVESMASFEEWRKAKRRTTTATVLGIVGIFVAWPGGIVALVGAGRLGQSEERALARFTEDLRLEVTGNWVPEPMTIDDTLPSRDMFREEEE